MLNHIVINGRLVADPELRYTKSNTPVASFRVAVERDFGEKDGVKAVDFINCVAWRSTAEFVNKYFFKGSMVLVSGRLQMESYKDKNGENRTSAEVVAEHVYFGESKQKGEKRTTVAPVDIPAGDWEELDDGADLPF